MHLDGDAAAARHGSCSQRPILKVAPAFLFCVALLVGCGDDSDPADGGSSALGSAELQLSAQEASCADWNEASVEQRQTIIDGLEATEGRPTTGAVGATLPDEEAYDLFDRYCPDESVRAVKLYKVYVRAAAFQSAEP